MGQRKEAEIRALLTARGLAGRPRMALAALEDIQAAFGYVPEAAIGIVAEVLGVNPGTIEELLRDCAEAFRRQPPGDQVELEACAGAVCARFLGEIRLSLEAAGLRWRETPCLGACDRAPALRLNGEVVAPADAKAIRNLKTGTS